MKSARNRPAGGVTEDGALGAAWNDALLASNGCVVHQPMRRAVQWCVYPKDGPQHAALHVHAPRVSKVHLAGLPVDSTVHAMPLFLSEARDLGAPTIQDDCSKIMQTKRHFDHRLYRAEACSCTHKSS